jgi:hypothetical protein
MKTRSSKEILPWLIGGVVFAGLLVALLLHFHQESSAAQQVAAKAARIDVVARMQLGLASASEAEKSAVLAITDQESQTFADQARATIAGVERDLQEISTMLLPDGTQRERDLLAQFSGTFRNLKAVDAEVLDLAVKNTNLKAYSLLFGAAASTLAEMDSALARVIAKHEKSPAANKLLSMAFTVRLGVLRIQAMLAPHIAEESDAKMDQMEAGMRNEETQIRRSLAGLGATAQGDADLETATARLARYEEIKTHILALSRENTNVRSLALSLSQKRNALAVCLDSLHALKAALLDEPIAGVTSGKPPRPR